MKTHRFFVGEPVEDTTVLTEPALVHQLSHVLRARAGDEFALCDGKGTDSRVVVEDISRSSINVRILARSNAWIPTTAITIYLAAIRKERFEWALEKCTEVGVTAFVPLLTERAERTAPNRGRAEKIIREAAEQCGRGSVSLFHEPVHLEDVPLDDSFVYCDMGGDTIESVVQRTPRLSERVSVLIGPEGGWTDRERAFLAGHGVIPISLGPTTLRAETAAIVASTRLMASVI